MKRKISYGFQCHFFVALVFCVSSVSGYAQGFLLQNTTICEGQSVNLSSDLTSGSLGTIEGFDGWYWGDDTQVYFDDAHKLCPELYGCSASLTTTTRYGVKYRKDGQEFRPTLTVLVIPKPILVVPAATFSCSGNAITLNASVLNSLPGTNIFWKYNSTYQTISNGGSHLPNTLGPHTYTAIASNAIQCSSDPEQKDYVVDVVFSPKTAKFEQTVRTPHCSKSTIDLTTLADFFVYDNIGNKASASSHSGTILWYAEDGITPIADPENVLLGTSNISFYADLSTIHVFYNNTTCPPLDYPLSGRQKIDVSVTSGNFTVKYNNRCSGDPLSAVFELNTNVGILCDKIESLDIVSAHTGTLTKNSTTRWILDLSPFTGILDTIKVRGKTQLGIDTIFALTLRKPIPPYFSYGTSCKNTLTYFDIIADSCDAITDVKIDIPIPYDPDFAKIADFQWRVKVPNLPAEASFSSTITYFSKLDGAAVTVTKPGTLSVWNDTPKLRVTLEETGEDFDPSHNLCAGDLLRFYVYLEHECDTIKQISLSGAGATSSTMTTISFHERMIKLKPSIVSGTANYTLTVLYMRAQETTPQTTTITYAVKVTPHPKVFVKDPPDVLEYCSASDLPPLDINDVGIDYSSVTPGSVTFRIDKGNGAYDSQTSFIPQESKNYYIGAEYQYTCSAMTSTSAIGEIRIVVSQRDKPAANYVIVPTAPFCITQGITLTGESGNEGTSYTWKYNGQTINKFPYAMPAGTHTITASIYNKCWPLASGGLSQPVSVKVDGIPTVTAMSAATVCYGDIVALKVLPGYVGNGPIWIIPPDANTISDQFEIKETTTFRVIVDNECGSAHDEVTVFRRPTPWVPVRDTSVCLNDQLQLRVLHHEGTIQWFDPLGTPLIGENPTVKITETASYRVTAANECGEDYSNLTVTALPLPFVEVVADTSICYGEPFVPTHKNAFGTLQWEPQNVVAITNQITFVCTAATERCGTYKDSLHAHVYPQLFLFPETDKIPNYQRTRPYDFQFGTNSTTQPIQFDIAGSLPKGLMASNERIFGVSDAGTDYKTYHLQVNMEDGNGCRVMKNYTLSPEWWAPNVLLPLGDRENAEFLPDFNVEIYTRNGILIHKGMGWNGRNNNALVPEGTYFYKTSALLDGVLEDHMGYVVVMYY